VVDEDTQPGRHLRPAGKIELKGRQRHRTVFQHAHQTRVGQLVGHQRLQRLRQTETALHQIDLDTGVIDDETPADFHLERAAVALEHPARGASARLVAIAHAFVRRQIFRRARRRAAHQIIRRGHGDHALRAADAHRHHVGLDAFTQPHAGVEARRNDVGKAIVEREFEPDLRVAHREAGQMRRDQQTVGDARHVDAHGAGSLAARLRQRFERTAQLLQPDPHAIVEAFAFFGQRHAARGAGQQAHAQPLFQTTDRLRKRRRGHAHFGCRTRKTGVPRNALEGGQRGQHRCIDL
jgi:hypothetical protein